MESLANWKIIVDKSSYYILIISIVSILIISIFLQNTLIDRDISIDKKDAIINELKGQLNK